MQKKKKTRSLKYARDQIKTHDHYYLFIILLLHYISIMQHYYYYYNLLKILLLLPIPFESTFYTTLVMIVGRTSSRRE